MTYRARIEVPPMPKKRPIVTKNGTYMPKKSVEWKDNVAEVMGITAKHMPGYVDLSVAFRRDSMVVTLHDADGGIRHGRSDIDNLVGGVMDALQESGVIDNDKDVVRIYAYFQDRP